VRVKELLGVIIPVHALVAHPTFAALASEIEQLTTSTTRPITMPPAPLPSREPPSPVLTVSPSAVATKSSLLICLQPGKPGHVPLFLFQSVGGTVYAYRELAARLGSAQPVYAFRASGMEPGEPLHSDFSAMVTSYLEELLRVQPGPYFLLGGYSSGGAIAYEMAAQLIQRGYQVPFVFLADSGPAAQYERMGIKTIADLLRVGKAFEKTAPQQWESLRTALSDTSPLHAVIIGTYQALATYKPQRSSAGIVYFRATERDEVLDPHPEAWWMEHADGRQNLLQHSGRVSA
jgi:thioesterase domain-containing protein